jgi:maltose phosphorylase
MKEGWYNRSLKQRFKTVPNSGQYSSFLYRQVGIINYEITLNKDTKIIYKPYIDAGVTNEDANWDEILGTLEVKKSTNEAL